MRGLRSHTTFFALRDLVRKFPHFFVFLCETKISQKKAKEIRVRLEFDGCFDVDSKEGSDGLILFWVAKLGISSFEPTK